MNELFTDLPPLRDDVLYDAEQAGRYIGRSALWMKRAARADEIPHVHIGRFYRWNATNIRQMVAGEPHKPRSCRICRRPSRRSA